MGFLTQNLEKIPKPKKVIKKIAKIDPSKNLIYDLKVENKLLKEENLRLKERLSDMSQTLKMNKMMLQDVIDKTTAEANTKAEQFRLEREHKDKVIEDLRANFQAHMNALIFT